MTYSIVFSSLTGNTALLAGALQDQLPAESCVYFGEPTREAVETPADVTFVGFWTDKNSCDAKTRIFLQKLDNRTIILFGTAGLGSDPEYFKQVLAAAAKEAPVSNTVLPGFMCRGKMKPEAKLKFQKIQAEKPDDPQVQKILEEYEKSVCHPNEDDLANLAAWAKTFHF